MVGASASASRVRVILMVRSLLPARDSSSTSPKVRAPVLHASTQAGTSPLETLSGHPSHFVLTSLMGSRPATGPKRMTPKGQTWHRRNNQCNADNRWPPCPCPGPDTGFRWGRLAHRELAHSAEICGGGQGSRCPSPRRCGAPIAVSRRRGRETSR